MGIIPRLIVDDYKDKREVGEKLTRGSRSIGPRVESGKWCLVTSIILFVAEGGLEVHARTQAKGICIEHGLIVSQELVRVVICSIGSFPRMWIELWKTMVAHGVRARNRCGIVKARHVRRGAHGRLMLLID